MTPSSIVRALVPQDPVTLLTGAIALIVTVTICIMAITERQIPSLLEAFGYIIMGAYFGSAVQRASPNRTQGEI